LTCHGEIAAGLLIDLERGANGQYLGREDRGHDEAEE
jgi:hypothetical protein